MRNVFSIAMLLCLFCAVSFADTANIGDSNTNISTAPPVPDTATAPKAGVGLMIGEHDAFLSEAPTLYQGSSVNIVRNAGIWIRDDHSYIGFGFLSGEAAHAGASLNVGFAGTTALSDLLETGIRVGMNLDVWSDGSLVGVPLVELNIESLLPNPTSLYATMAYGVARVPSSQINIQASRLYGFIGMKQRVGFLGLDAAVGNHSTMRLGLTIEEIRVFGTETTISPGVELLRSPGRNSVALFLTSGAF